MEHERAVATADRDQSAVGAESGDPRGVGARIAHAGGASVDVPGYDITAGMIVRGEVPSIGAEGEKPDVSVTLTPEPGNLMVVAHAADQDRPIAVSSCVAGHTRVIGECDGPLRRADRGTGRLHVGQAPCRRWPRRGEDRRSRGEPQIAADPGRLGKRRQRVKPLTDAVAEPAGSGSFELDLGELESGRCVRIDPCLSRACSASRWL